MTPSAAPARHGLLLIAHGARDPGWAAPFEAVAASVRQAAPGLSVALAYLEFMSPGIHEAGEHMARQGCTQVDLVPLFLGAGGHVRKDVPAIVASLSAGHPGTRFRLHPAVGESPAVIEAMARSALAMAGEPSLPQAPTTAATPRP